MRSGIKLPDDFIEMGYAAREADGGYNRVNLGRFRHFRTTRRNNIASWQSRIDPDNNSMMTPIAEAAGPGQYEEVTVRAGSSFTVPDFVPPEEGYERQMRANHFETVVRPRGIRLGKCAAVGVVGQGAIVGMMDFAGGLD